MGPEETIHDTNNQIHSNSGSWRLASDIKKYNMVTIAAAPSLLGKESQPWNPAERDPAKQKVKDWTRFSTEPSKAVPAVSSEGWPTKAGERTIMEEHRVSEELHTTWAPRPPRAGTSHHHGGSDSIRALISMSSWTGRNAWQRWRTS